MFGWNALSVMLKEQGNYDRQCTQSISGTVALLCQGFAVSWRDTVTAGSNACRQY